ncbi:unnamed protein product [Brachionus calyciflorus]|uniref:SAP domain-containing protein n=1 Tax=Brachionus calyciflorus TaxID=104777 RepID=A0A814EI92_9BILA|nr:unnamed protein product [Brachionus calyciflorus]
MYNCSWKVVDLQAECKKLKLSYAGKKSDLVKRLDNYTKDAQPAETGALSDSVKSQDELIDVEVLVENHDFNQEDEEEEMVQNEYGKRVKASYIKFEEFLNLEAAVARLEESPFCGKSCPKLAYILLHQDDDTASIWYNSTEHDHTSEKYSSGINEVTKKQIEVLYKSFVNTATRIRLALRDRSEPYLPKKFESDPNLPNDLYIPGIVIPTNLQINNYLNNTLRPKLQGRTGKNKFSYGDLSSWIEANSIVPDNDHEPFVIDSLIHYNEKYPSLRLKAIYNYEFKPEILIADGAEAITNGFINAFNYKSIDEFNLVMCWAHVHRAIDTRTKSIDESLRSQIRTDINLIQLSPNNGWYEGFSVNIPSTDNGLESINGEIKLIHTLRTRLSVNAFLSNLENMLRHWSKYTLKEKIFVGSVSFSQQSWKLASSFLNSGNALIKKIGNSENFILLDKSDSILLNVDYVNSRYKKLENDKKINFDKLISFQSASKRVNLNTEDWSSSRFTCNFFFKNYYCSHIISLAVNQKLVVMPLKYNQKAIAPKAKSGRPAKAKACLVRQ